MAEQLFPDNVHARHALNRVAKGEGYLYEPQIRKLAELTGATIAELFGEDEWKLAAAQRRGSVPLKSREATSTLTTDPRAGSVRYRISSQQPPSG